MRYVYALSTAVRCLPEILFVLRQPVVTTALKFCRFDMDNNGPDAETRVGVLILRQWVVGSCWLLHDVVYKTIVGKVMGLAGVRLVLA